MPVIHSRNTQDLLRDMAHETPFERSDYCDRLDAWITAINEEERLLERFLINTIENMADGTKHRMLTSQQIMLGAEEHLVVRMNLWPTLSGRGDHERAELDRYSYEAAHDHNFSFVTIGHHGPGYRTEIYEYRREDVKGHIGEQVNLTFKATEHLTRGKRLWFKSGRDVHAQFTPESLSASINILVREDGEIEQPQYYFDLDRKVITSFTVNNVSKQMTILDTCAMIDDELCRDVIRFYARQERSATLRDYAAKKLVDA